MLIFLSKFIWFLSICLIPAQCFSSSQRESPVQCDEQMLHWAWREYFNIFRFRWDYFKIYRDMTGHDLEGFKQFIAGGVRAEYLESVFPAESFPAWQTIQTGEPSHLSLSGSCLNKTNSTIKKYTICCLLLSDPRPTLSIFIILCLNKQRRDFRIFCCKISGLESW